MTATPAPPPETLTPRDCKAARLSCPVFNTRVVTRHLTNLNDHFLRSSGLTSGQFMLLMGIYSLEYPTMRDLARTLSQESSALTHNMKPLVRDQLVRLTRGNDRRSKHLTLTDLGLLRLKLAYTAWQQGQAKLAELFPNGEISELNRILRQVDEGLERESVGLDLAPESGSPSVPRRISRSG